jgi:hypothetical protein
MYQRIQGKFAARPEEELQSRNIVSPANAVTIVKFATKILLDQGPPMLDFALSSKEETCQFLLVALRHRLEFPGSSSWARRRRWKIM